MKIRRGKTDEEDKYDEEMKTKTANDKRKTNKRQM